MGRRMVTERFRHRLFIVIVVFYFRFWFFSLLVRQLHSGCRMFFGVRKGGLREPPGLPGECEVGEWGRKSPMQRVWDRRGVAAVRVRVS